MINEKLQRQNETLLGPCQAFAEWQSVLPPGTSTGTAFALGEALIALAKATNLFAQDIGHS
jgi:hypothetical protein